jgi:hypothetical protein
LPAPQFTTDASFSRQAPLGRSEGLAGLRNRLQLEGMNADRSPHQNHPSDAARVREVAGLLALGLVRLMQRKSTVLSPTLAEKELDVERIQSMCAKPSSQSREAA